MATRNFAWQQTVTGLAVNKQRQTLVLPAFDYVSGRKGCAHLTNDVLGFTTLTITDALAITGDFTISFWTKLEQLEASGDAEILNVGAIRILVHDGQFQVKVKTSAWYTIAAPFNVVNGAWYYLTAMFDENGYLRLYVDGEMVVDTTALGTGTLDTGAITDLTMPDVTALGTIYPDVFYSHLYIWNRLLSDDEIAFFQTHTPSVVDTALKLLMPFYEDAGTDSDIYNIVTGNSFNFIAAAPDNDTGIVNDYPPRPRIGCSYPIAEYSIDSGGVVFSLSYPNHSFDELEYLPVVSYVNSSGDRVAYRLGENSSFLVWPMPELYRGQRLNDGAKIEIFAIDGYENAYLAADYSFKISLLSTVTTTTYNTSTVLATLEANEGIATTFPLVSPFTFNTQQTF